MKLFATYLLLVSAAFAQTYADYRTALIVDEGHVNMVYTDTRGNPSVGIGHKLTPGDRFVSPISDEVIETLFVHDLAAAIEGARRQVPSFPRQPKEVKVMLVSMSFNLGEKGLSKFIKFRQSIEESNYAGAANELRNSLYFKQLPNRVGRYIAMLEQVNR